MNTDDLAAKFPRSARLLGGFDGLNVDSTGAALVDDGNERLVTTTGEPAVLINLADLESALTGFRDTGTWDDYFPPADDSSENTRLTVPNRAAGIARYRIDTDDAT